MKQIPVSEASGKRLAHVEHDPYNGLLLVFDDDTFSAVEARQEYDSVYLYDCEEDMWAMRRTFGDKTLIDAGVLTAEEVAAQDERMRAERRTAQELSEMLRLRRLIAKYGPQN